MLFIAEISWFRSSIHLQIQPRDCEGIYSEALKKNKAVNSKRIEGWLLSDLAYAEYGLGRIDLAKHHIWLTLRIAADVRQYVVCQFAFNTLIVILAGEGLIERAIELESLLRSQHPLFDQGWYQRQLRKPFDRSIAALIKEVVTIPRETGRQLDYWQTAESLVTELEQWHLGSSLSSQSTP